MAEDVSAEKPLPRLIVWGGGVGAVVLVGLLVFVYILVLGNERPEEELLSRTEAAISGEETQLVPDTETSAEIDRIIANLESSRGEQSANGDGDESMQEDPDGEAGFVQPHDRNSFFSLETTRRMAYWLTDQYFPKGTHPSATREGILATGISRANTQAASLIGISEKDGEPPVYLKALDYAFTPDMLEELYRIHAGTFVESFGQALNAARRKVPNAESRPLTAEERAECVTLYARLFDQISRSLNAYMNLPDHSRRLNAWLSARERLAAVGARAAEARAEYARLEKNGQDSVEKRQMLQLTILTEDQAVPAEARARENLLEGLWASDAVKDIDSGTLLYVACWAERRIAARRENSETVNAAAEILRRLARDLQGEPDAAASPRPRSNERKEQ